MKLPVVIDDSPIKVPDDLVQYLIVHSGEDEATCRIVVSTYVMVLKHFLKIKESLIVYRLKIRGKAKEPNRLMANV